MMLFYSAEECAVLHRQARRGLFAAAGAALAALCGCIALCCMVTTGHAACRLWEVIALSTAGGWAAILLGALVWRPDRAQYRHVQRLLEEEGENREGVLGPRGDRWLIPGGLAVRKITLRQGDTSQAVI